MTSSILSFRYFIIDPVFFARQRVTDLAEKEETESKADGEVICPDVQRVFANGRSWLTELAKQDLSSQTPHRLESAAQPREDNAGCVPRLFGGVPCRSRASRCP